MPVTKPTPSRDLTALMRRGFRFLAVGGVAFIVDVVVFNLLVHGPGGGPMEDRPLTGKIISTLVSALVSFFGNKLWTFDDRASPGAGHQVVAFVLVNGVAWGVNLAPLAFSRYVLGLDSALADNISGSVIGLGAAIVFRFWAYGRWVFVPRSEEAQQPE